MSERDFYSIGQFSKITGLSVKTLRFYHEQGLLVPRFVDDQTGYRYYDDRNVEAARIIAGLRGLDFPVAEIGEILKSCADDADVLESLERQKGEIEERMRHDGEIARSLDQIISHEREARRAMQQGFEVQEKMVDDMLIAGVRMKGKYSDCGKGFGRIGKRFGRYICGKAFLLHYDSEYHEDDADFEACMPIRQGQSVDGISVRSLPGGRCFSLLHKGPYDELGRSYAKVFKHLAAGGHRAQMPTREVYLKGPGMIFKGNPKNYLTEIQILIDA